MTTENTFFPWSDNWYIENDKAWCIDGERNLLYCIDLDLKECIHVKEIPEIGTERFRLNSRLIKCGNDVFCMPDRGDSIWIYQLENLQFKEIKIVNPNRVRIAIIDFWQDGDRILAVSNGLKQLIDINIRNKQIENYYNLNNTLKDVISMSIKVDTLIYSVSVTVNKIFQFDINTKETTIYTFDKIKSGFRTICFDGQLFWLSGYRKEIYAWHKENNDIKILDRFPQRFGIYNFQEGVFWLDYENVIYNKPIFIYSIAIGQYIWFIPNQSNKITYVDKESFEIYCLEIDGEDETKNSFTLRGIKNKYLLEYVKENRYIGLFSLKNNYILEIDSIEKKVIRKIYSYNHMACQELMEIYDKCEGYIYNENRDIDRIIFKEKLINIDIKEIKKIGEDIGLNIYKDLFTL